MRYSLMMLFVLLPITALGQENSSWIGRRVITHFGAVLKVGNQVVDDENRSTNLAVSGRDKSSFRVYRVERGSGDWLWLKAEKEGAEGWVKAGHVIPYDEAIDDFTGQIRANPSQASWLIRRGAIWEDKGEHDIALADYNEALRLESRNEAAWINRGNVWMSKKDFDRAVGDYSEAIKIDPKEANAYYNRGRAWRVKKEYDRAIADFNEAIRLDPKDAWAYKERAWLRATCPDDKYRDGNRAFADASRACQLSGYKAAYPLGSLAAACAERGDFPKAIEYQEKANKLYTDDRSKQKGDEWLKLYKQKKPNRHEDGAG